MLIYSKILFQLIEFYLEDLNCRKMEDKEKEMMKNHEKEY